MLPMMGMGMGSMMPMMGMNPMMGMGVLVLVHHSRMSHLRITNNKVDRRYLWSQLKWECYTSGQHADAADGAASSSNAGTYATCYMTRNNAGRRRGFGDYLENMLDRPMMVADNMGGF